MDTAQQQTRFEQEVLDILGPGDGTPEFPGLQQFVGEDGAFSSDMHVQAVIISPRDRWNPVEGVMLYADLVQQLARKVTQIFGGNWDTGDKGNLSAPIILNDYTPNALGILQEWTATGKAIFQYDPVQGRCINAFTGEPAQFAQQRLWFEERPNPVVDYFWPVWPDQVVPDSDQQQKSKRRSFQGNEKEDEVDYVELKERQEAWTPGVQPSLYPSCLAAVENTGTGPAEATAVLVGPNGAIGGNITESSATITRAITNSSPVPTPSPAYSTSVTAASYATTTSTPLCYPL